jgi:cell division protease FtsH
LLDRAAAILRENRSSVLTLAHALETHKTLTGDDVEAVLEGREGTAVDGSVYRQPGFLRELEAYHEAAVAAHQGHGRVMVALPEAAESGPSAAADSA